MNSDNKEEMLPIVDEQGNIVELPHEANVMTAVKTSSGSAPPRIQQQR